jgi:glycosyltransferase involved in cell wall biosynthesis
MSARVAILHQGFIPEYRVRFYELLAERPGIQYVVFHGRPYSGSGWQKAEGPFSFANRWVENREIMIGRWTAIYQPVVREILNGGYSAVVLGHEVKFLSSLLLAFLCKLKGVSVLYWGFGYHVKLGIGFTAEASGLMATGARLIKNALTRLCDGYLAYTQGGADRLARIGFPRDRTFVLRNTIDIAELSRVRDAVQDADTGEIRRALGLRPDSVVVMFIGRLLEAKQIDVLIDAVCEINQNGLARHFVEALIVGSGPLEPVLRTLAAEAPGVRLLGGIQDQRLLALYMRVAVAVIIPGQIGLAVNHAFALGRPLITRKHQLHSPEVEYLIDGENGLIIEGGRETFVDVLARFVDSPEWQERLAAGALKSREALRIEHMVESFDLAVRRTIERKHGRLKPAPAMSSR